MAYWFLTLALVVVGLLTGFSIGQPILLLALALILLGPFRNRPRVFWPPFLAVVAFDLAYWALVPLSCTATSSIGGGEHTVCTSLLGGRFEGEGIVNPSRVPATVAGLVAAAVALTVVFAVLTWRERRTARGGPRSG